MARLALRMGYDHLRRGICSAVSRSSLVGLNSEPPNAGVAATTGWGADTAVLCDMAPYRQNSVLV